VEPARKKHEREAALDQAPRREVKERQLESSHEERVEFVCECSNQACEELVSLTVEECEFVRRVPDRLVVRMGHVDYASEHVIMEEPGRFQVLEKFGPGQDVVAHLYLRAPSRHHASPARRGRRA
jgi:hypothetical protein